MDVQPARHAVGSDERSDTPSRPSPHRFPGASAWRVIDLAGLVRAGTTLPVEPPFWTPSYCPPEVLARQGRMLRPVSTQ